MNLIVGLLMTQPDDKKDGAPQERYHDYILRKLRELKDSDGSS
jgi:hypothetical protein